jgi:hypothetical protein
VGGPRPAQRHDRPVGALDVIDVRRFDAEAICAATTRFAELSNEEQEEYVSLCDFAGMLGAEHPFTDLLLESNDATCMVRDLDGVCR